MNIELPQLPSARREYSLYDQFGRLAMMSILEGQGNGNDGLDIAALPAGVYSLCR
ncbi:MAG: T9SS type A sorting domain-containing protein, partial [Saprospiraceae bacterium]|nr:T9SS type A sorting domain-containing protein [Saprospiraceae bacterium]